MPFEMNRLVKWLFYGPGARSFPWLLLGYAAVSFYTIFYYLAYYQMYAAVTQDRGLDLILVEPDNFSTKAGAITIWLVLGFVRLWWLLSWLLAVLRSTAILRDPHQVPKRHVMQTTAAYVLLEWAQNRSEAVRHQRPRLCGIRDCSLAGQTIGDRVYHCTSLEKKNQADGGKRPIHLPLYDHTCHWIRVIIFLDTIKPYLLAILFMTLDAIIVLSISIFALTRRSMGSYRVHDPVAVMTALIITYLSGSNAYKRWWHIACRNRVDPELDHEAHKFKKLRFAVALPRTIEQDYNFGAFEDERRRALNPWDLGTMENLRAALGGWSCLLFWRQPTRVREYGTSSPFKSTDFEMSEQFWAWHDSKVLEGRERAGLGRITTETVAQAIYGDRPTVSRSSGNSYEKEMGPIDRRHPRELTNSDVAGASDAWSIPERRTVSDMV